MFSLSLPVGRFGSNAMTGSYQTDGSSCIKCSPIGQRALLQRRASGVSFRAHCTLQAWPSHAASGKVEPMPP